MRSLGVVEDEIIGKLLVKERFVMDNIQMNIYKLLLYGSIVSLNITIDFGTIRIGKEMRDTIS